MHKQSLHEQWTVEAVGDLSNVPETVRGRAVPATVPGCVHTDLLAAGLIVDPYLDRNEASVQWIGETDWTYRCRFTTDPGLWREEKIELVCEGLDTIAQVEINGQRVGGSQDMHLPCRWDVRGALKQGANELTVTFHSALRYARAMREKMGLRPHVNEHPFNYIRKMACNFGWDWGPALVTAGVWRPVALQGWSTARIETVRPLVTEAGPDRATVMVHVDAASSGGGFRAAATLTGPDGRSLLPASTEGLAMRFDVREPRLWWPRGYGDQPLYALEVTLTDEAGMTLDQWSGRVGLRSVRINTEKDAVGTPFTVEINGRPVFCKGANWIPDDCFPHRVTPQRYRQRITQAVEANMNMLRVWGGGIYESDAFYDVCDELGVLVWQDFLFACAAYPEEEPFGSLVEAEARHHVARLSRHASLVLWNGCNENIWGWFDWGWKLLLAPLGKTWGLRYYLEVLPKVVEELDPSRPYWPGSPFSGTMDIHPLEDAHGNKHVWDAWNDRDYAIYRQYTPRFVSEFGHQAPPTFATIWRAIPEDQRRSHSPAMLSHQKARDGTRKLEDRLAEHFEVPAPDAFDRWVYLLQVNQARAIQTGVEWFRSRSPVCMGTLYWQLNDCWPVSSWAAIDGDGRPKPLWHATRRFYADRLLTIQPEPDGSLVLHAINDSDLPWEDRLRVSRLTFHGAELLSDSGAINVSARSRQRVATLGAGLARPEESATQVLIAQALTGGQRAMWYFDIDRRLAYPAPAFESHLESTGELHRLTVKAHVLLRDLSVLVDRLDPKASIDDQLVTLLPGESATFTIRSRENLSVQSMTQFPVLQCANPPA